MQNINLSCVNDTVDKSNRNKEEEVEEKKRGGNYLINIRSPKKERMTKKNYKDIKRKEVK